MAKKIYTTIARYVGTRYVQGSPEDPKPVHFPKGFDPLSRKVKRKVTETVIQKRKQQIVSPKGEKFEIEVEYPVSRESEVEERIPFTAEELAANGLIVVDEADQAPAGEKLKPHFAQGETGAAPAAHTRDVPGGRPSDEDPAAKK